METIHLKPSETPPGPGSTDGAPEGARRATAGAPSGGRRPMASLIPDPEVAEKKPRRKFTAKYKLKILSEADALTAPGQMGALLRREGLYSSNISAWRRQRDQGLLHALSPKKRGRKKKHKNPLTDKVAQLEKQNRWLQHKLKQAELIIEAQKKMSEILGLTRNLDEDIENK